MTGRVPGLLVAALGSAFGVALLQISGALTATAEADPDVGASATVGTLLTALALVFMAIAVYVGAIVTVNTVATVVAGRARRIALLRLLGSSAVAQRRAIAREGLITGAVGALLGAVLGTLAARGIVEVGVALGWLPRPAYGWASPALAVPVVAVVLTTWLSSWLGSRRVLTVTPLQALGSSEQLSAEEVRARPVRNATAVVLAVLGTAVLLLGVGVGLVSPLGVLIGVLGGILSFSGLVMGAHLVMPPALALVGRLLGRGAAGRLAAANARRHPERSSRTTIGLVIGVTLVTMFGVAIESFRRMVEAAQAAQPDVYQGIGPMLDATTAVFSVLVGFSALIAGVGLVNSLSLSVLQRTRELGLLRAVGFSRSQLSRMVLAESAQLTITGVLVGLLLGGFYGWCGAQALLGSAPGVGTLIPPGIPWTVLAVVVVVAAVLTVVAAAAPARRAARLSPVAALGVE
ncbi:MAG: ABC transporter permease [Micrococcales bacterium]|nr:ABC transporter permease [Micrococcales bacterium]